MAKKHGGKRKGAGRKPKGVVRYSITFPEAMAKEVAAFCETGKISRSAFFEMAADAFLRKFPRGEKK